jgi:hypothetical protein
MSCFLCIASARRLIAALIATCWLVIALPAQAAVTITFWSHEFGNDFPHAFFTMRGVPDAGGEPIDMSFGFTAKAVTPAILFGTVPGKVERPTISYMKGSDARFSVTLTDAQYAGELALIQAWDKSRGGDSRYNLNRRNCVHFVKEAARIAGLAGLEHPDLMKKPRSYLLAVAAANEGKIERIDQDGDKYLAALPPLAPRPSPAPDLHVLPPARAGEATTF